MPLVPNPNVARVEMVATQAGQTVQNVLHFVLPGGWSDLQLGQLADYVVTWITSTLDTQTSNQVEYTEVTAQVLADPLGIKVSRDPNTNGAVASPAMPNNVTAVISLKTNLAGRSFRGRLYHIGLTEGQCENSSLVGGFDATLRTTYEALRTGAIPGGANWCVYSQFQNGAPRVTGQATAITSIVVNSTLDSQRRRLPGRGR